MKKLVIFIAFLLVVVSGLYLVRNTSRKQQSAIVPSPVYSSPEVKVAFVNYNRLYEIPLAVASNKGFFNKYKLKVKIQAIQKSPTKLLVGNKVDILLALPYSPLSANVEGANLLWIGNVLNDFPTVIVSFKDPKALNTVGVAGAFNKIISKNMLKKVNVNTDNVTFQDMISSQVGLTALMDKKIDAIGGIPAIEWEIFRRKNNLSDKEFKVLISTRGDEDSQFSGGIIVKSQYLKENKETIDNFLKSIIESTYWINKNREKAITLISKNFNVSTDEATVYIDDYISVTKDLKIAPDKEKGQALLRLLEKDNSKAKDYDISNFISTSVSDSIKNSGFLSKFDLN